MLYQIIKDLPALPEELKKMAWEYTGVERDDALNPWVLGYTHGRALGKDNKEYGHSTGLPRKQISEAFNQWIYDNITDLFHDVGICVSKTGFDHCGPHRDQSRAFTLMYVLKQGSNDAITTFWKEKPGVPVQNYYDNYDELEFLDQINIPLETWCMLDAKAIHSVENIQEGRVSVQVSLNQNPWIAILSTSPDVTNKG